MDDNKILELETRKQIYNYILKYPGLHIRDLSRQLDLPKSTLTYHLKYLKKHGFIEENLYENYTRYYALKQVDRYHKEILNLFREEASRRVILYLAQNQFSTIDEISKHIRKHRSTVSHHLKKLSKAGIIKYHNSTGKKRYQLLEGSGRLLFAILSHEDSFDEETKRVIKKAKNKMDKQGIDEVMEIVWDIFPHPYYA
jgi:predicted transcriptional regulator